MNIGEILVRFTADIAGFAMGVQTLSGLLTSFGATAVLVGAAVVAALAGIAFSIAIISTKAAADFQQGMNRLVTGAGDVTDNMKQMGQAILGISTSTGVLTGQLLPAMYQIISAGQRGAQAEDTLRVAAMGSVVEQAKVVDVAKALTTAMTDYGTKQFNATQFMNGFTRATQLGKLTLEQLSTSMGPILPLAHNVGISFADIAGAMSTMTNAGIPAERAATSLRFLMQSLENPTKKATTAMTEMGLSSVAVGNELKKSLPGALEMIYQAALKAGPEGSVPFNRAVSDMIGGQRSLQAYLSLTGTHFATYEANVKAIAAAMNGSKTAVLGWDVAQSNFNTKLAQAHAALDALFITIGAQLLPVLTRVVGELAPIISRFADWVTSSHAIENAIAALTPYFNAFFDILKVGLPLVVGLFMQFIRILGQVITWLGQNKAVLEALMVIVKALAIVIVAVLGAGLLFLAASFVALGVVIFGIIGVVMFLIEVWKMLVAAAGWVSGAWHSVIGWLGGAWHSLVAIATSAWNGIRNAVVSAVNATVSWIRNAFNAVIAWLVGAWNACVAAVVAAFNWLYNHNYYFKQLIDTIRNVVSAGIAWLTSAWNTAVAWLGAKWAQLKGLAQSAWDGVRAVFAAVWGWLSGILNSLWASISGWFSSTASGMQTKTTGAWQGVSQVFSSAWGTYISGPLNSLAGNIGGFFNNLAAQMVQFGANLIQGLVNGINSMLGAVSSAASNVASTITGILGFHSPPAQGPAADADTWMPNMVALLTKGMTMGVPSITRAATELAQPIQGSLSSVTPHAGSTSGGTNNRPIIIQIGQAEYRGFVQNLGRDLATTVVIQRGGMR